MNRIDALDGFYNKILQKYFCEWFEMILLKTFFCCRNLGVNSGFTFTYFMWGSTQNDISVIEKASYYCKWRFSSCVVDFKQQARIVWRFPMHFCTKFSGLRKTDIVLMICYIQEQCLELCMCKTIPDDAILDSLSKLQDLNNCTIICITKPSTQTGHKTLFTDSKIRLSCFKNQCWKSNQSLPMLPIKLSFSGIKVSRSFFGEQHNCFLC